MGSKVQSKPQQVQQQVTPIQAKFNKLNMQFQLFSVEINETISMLMNEISAKDAKILNLQTPVKEKQPVKS